MVENNFSGLHVVLGAFILLLIFGCISNPQEQGKGILQGHISIGPLCPVERNPPDPNCLPTEQTYAAYAMTVYRVGAGDPGPLLKETTFTGDKDGNYKIELPTGSYVIRQETGISKFSKTVAIKAGETTTLDIDIDTGIR
jgi:hypothetical protein